MKPEPAPPSRIEAFKNTPFVGLTGDRFLRACAKYQEVVKRQLKSRRLRA